MDLDELANEFLKDPEFRAEYERPAKKLSAEDVARLFLHDGERLVEYTVVGEYVPGYCLIPADEDLSRIDFAGCLEETLHRILDEKDEHRGLDGMSADDVIGLVMLADQNIITDGEEQDGAFCIDLGYGIHSGIQSAFPV